MFNLTLLNSFTFKYISKFTRKPYLKRIIMIKKKVIAKLKKKKVDK